MTRMVYALIHFDRGENVAAEAVIDAGQRALKEPGDWSLGLDIVATRGVVQRGEAHQLADTIAAYVNARLVPTLTDLVIGITDDEAICPVYDALFDRTRPLEKVVRPPYRVLLRPWAQGRPQLTPRLDQLEPLPVADFAQAWARFQAWPLNDVVRARAVKTTSVPRPDPSGRAGLVDLVSALVAIAQDPAVAPALEQATTAEALERVLRRYPYPFTTISAQSRRQRSLFHRLIALDQATTTAVKSGGSPQLFRCRPGSASELAAYEAHPAAVRLAATYPVTVEGRFEDGFATAVEQAALTLDAAWTETADAGIHPLANQHLWGHGQPDKDGLGDNRPLLWVICPGDPATCLITPGEHFPPVRWARERIPQTDAHILRGRWADEADPNSPGKVLVKLTHSLTMSAAEALAAIQYADALNGFTERMPLSLVAACLAADAALSVKQSDEALTRAIGLAAEVGWYWAEKFPLDLARTEAALEATYRRGAKPGMADARQLAQAVQRLQLDMLDSIPRPPEGNLVIWAQFIRALGGDLWRRQRITPTFLEDAWRISRQPTGTAALTLVSETASVAFLLSGQTEIEVAGIPLRVTDPQRGQFLWLDWIKLLRQPPAVVKALFPDRRFPDHVRLLPVDPPTAEQQLDYLQTARDLTQELRRAAAADAHYVPYGTFRLSLPANTVTSRVMGITSLMVYADGATNGLWFRACKHGKWSIAEFFDANEQPAGLEAGWQTLLEFTLAALWYDLRVRGPEAMPAAGAISRPAAAPADARPRPKQRPAHGVALPRPSAPQRVEISGRRTWSTPADRAYMRMVRSLSGHVRRLHQGWHRGAQAQRNADAVQIVLPNGYTYVVPHQRRVRRRIAEGTDPQQAVAAEPMRVIARGLATLLSIGTEPDISGNPR